MVKSILRVLFIAGIGIFLAGCACQKHAVVEPAPCPQPAAVQPAPETPPPPPMEAPAPRQPRN